MPEINHDAIDRFSHLWGMMFFIAMFAVALAYALWPKNRDRFRRAAYAPLDDAPPHAADRQED